MPTDRRHENRSRDSARGALLTGAAVVALVAAVLAVLSWTRPLRVPSTSAYTEVGRLAYSAATPAGSVYGADGLVTGEPIYGSVVKAIQLRYHFQLSPAGRSSLGGKEQLVAIISDGQGLSRVVPIQPLSTTFRGPGFTASGTLELSSLAAIAQAYDTATAAVSGVSTYSVSIGARVSLSGKLAGGALSSSFDRPSSFTFTDGSLLPVQTSSPSQLPQPEFTRHQGGKVESREGGVALLPLGIPVSGARVGSLAALLGALLLLGLAGWPLLREVTSPDESARIAARHASLLVPSGVISPPAGTVVVQLSSFEGLLQVARRLECPVLWWREHEGDVYAVIDSGTLYRYRSVVGHGPLPERGRAGERPRGGSRDQGQGLETVPVRVSRP